MTRILIALVLLALLTYGAIEVRPLLAGPSLTIDSPVEAGVYPDGLVKISGRAARATSLTLSGGPLLSDEHGNFETELAYPAGGSILTLTATDRFGRSVTKQRTLYIPTSNNQ